MDLPKDQGVIDCLNEIAGLLGGVKFTPYETPTDCAVTIWWETPYLISVHGSWKDLVEAVRKCLEGRKLH